MLNTTHYKAGTSLLHRTDPRVKLFLLLLLTSLLFFLESFSALFLLFSLSLFLWKRTELRFHLLLSYIRMFCPLFLLLILMQTLFFPGKELAYSPLFPDTVPLIGGMGKLSFKGFLFGLLLSFRVLTLMSLLPLLLRSTSIEELALAMVHFGLPYKLAFTTTTALNQLPILKSDITSIINAQKLRGSGAFERGSILTRLKAFPQLVVPLVMGAMRRAGLMGIAMDSRAFGTSKTRTFLVTLKMRARDYLLCAFGLLFFALLFWLNGIAP